MINQGRAIIAAYVKDLPHSAGVYRMLNKDGDVLYVGKAKSLKKRVANYTQVAKLPNRLQRMVAETASMLFVTTHTEVEALLLENNLIKKYEPRYNVLLKDDKTFAHILLATDHPFPQIIKHRGAKKRQGHYFGPFASAGAVKQTIEGLQRAFGVRPCSDSYFAARSRPCLQYQIKRCCAPCVGYVSVEDYAARVSQACDVLNGKSRHLQEDLAKAMQTASDALDFERAALYRDRIRALTSIQAKQDINMQGVSDADVIALAQEGGNTCIQVFFIRGGQNFGNRAFFPKHDPAQDIGDILEAFVGQLYFDMPCPKRLVISHPLPNAALLEEALQQQHGHRVHIMTAQRGKTKALLSLAMRNAENALALKLADTKTHKALLEGVQKLFGLPRLPQRIEVYDNSHIQGRHAVGAMIVAGNEGFRKTAYRQFTMDASVAQGGDDYGMMRHMLTRRLTRLADDASEPAPDLLLIDGGAGQLSVAREVLTALNLRHLPLVAIAKGEDRNAGRETFYPMEGSPFTLPPNDPVLYFLQRLRDEAHRFAIGSHRAKRTKAIKASLLDDLPNIGAARKKALLAHFGSAKAVARAGLADLEAVDGISKALAAQIYAHFQG